MPESKDPLVVTAAVLDGALSHIRELIEDAVRSHHYSKLGALGEVADGLASLKRSFADQATVRSDAAIGAGAAGPVATGTGRGARGSTGNIKSRRTYPRFERHGDRLVKVGWSKRDAAEYVHKASRVAVDAVVAALMTIAKKSFTMEEILPLRDKDGADVPSYQAYLVIAWLRQLGVVERLGNDGYAAQRDRLCSGVVESEWNSLTAS